MCQSIAEGGRRCPTHRHDTRALIRLLSEASEGYSDSLYHAAFLDLRRTNRGVDLTDENRAQMHRSVDTGLALVDEQTSGRQEDAHSADDATLMSLATLVREDVVSEHADNAILAVVNADTPETSRAIFSHVYENMAEDENFFVPPSALNVARQALGTEGRLHQDPRAVKTFAIIQRGYIHTLDLEAYDDSVASPPRISSLNSLVSRHSPVAAGGYSPETATQNSRLEIALRDDLDTTLAYQNVTEAQWSQIEQGGHAAAETVNEIRLNPDCRYASEEDAESARLEEDRSPSAQRCLDCGQFSGNVAHACPARQLNAAYLNIVSTPDFRESELPHEEVVIPQQTLTAAVVDNATSSEEVAATATTLDHPSAEDLLGRLSFESIDTSSSRTSNSSRTHVQRIKNFRFEAQTALFDSGLASPDEHDSNDLIVYSSEYNYNEGNYDYSFHSRIPYADRSAILQTHSGVYRRETGRLLDENRTWGDEYGTIPEDAVSVEVNSTYSTAIAPVASTARLMGLTMPYSHRSSDVSTLGLGEERRGDRDKWKFGRTREIRSKLENGETIIVPFVHEYDGVYSYNRRNGFVDAEGWEIRPGSRNTHSLVTAGEVALKKDESGKVRVVGIRDIRCNQCLSGNCTHVGYSIRQTAYIAQAALAPRETGSGGTRSPRRTPNPETGLPVSLENQCRVTRDEDGVRTITFTNTGNPRSNNVSVRRLDTSATMTAENAGMQISTTAPNPTHITRALRNAQPNETVVVPVSTEFLPRRSASYDIPGVRSSFQVVSGSISYGRSDDGAPFVRERSLQCNCDVYARNYSCTHVRRVEAGEMSLLSSSAEQDAIERVAFSHEEIQLATDAVAVQQREATLGREITLEEAATLGRREMNLEFREREELRRTYSAQLEAIHLENQRREELATLAGYTEQREKMAARYAAFDGPRYSEDYDAFEAEAKAVRDRIAAGEDPLTYETESVLNGIGDDTDTARKFGVELEVVFPGGSGKREVAAALSAAGLSASSSVGGYHSGQRSGWAKWTAENDCTVDLEVVSPIMNDTPENWAQIQQVCDIIKSKGGSVNYQTGSHVHISTGDYGSSVSAHAALLDEFSRYSDILYRLGSNPETKTHRGTQWCSPNTVSAGSQVTAAENRFRNVSSYLGAPHSSAVNFEASGEGKKSHAEIRLWDGSLNHNVIQMQIMLTAAMTEVAAQRVNREDEDKFTYSSESEQLPLGTSKDKRFRSKKEETAKFREMLDRYFPRESDRKRFIALWETTKWQNASRRGY